MPKFDFDKAYSGACVRYANSIYKKKLFKPCNPEDKRLLTYEMYEVSKDGVYFDEKKNKIEYLSVGYGDEIYRFIVSCVKLPVNPAQDALDIIEVNPKSFDTYSEAVAYAKLLDLKHTFIHMITIPLDESLICYIEKQ